MKIQKLLFLFFFLIGVYSVEHYQKSETTDGCAEAGKRSWPELVGINGNIAEVIIKRDNPKVNPEIVDENTMVTTGIVCDRVRVWVDKNRIVNRTPQVG